MRTKKKQAFTLVEIMVVISVIAILMTASFKLMRAAAYEKKVAETRARMQRIENALSGYFAANGHYPPVPVYSDWDPEKITESYDNNGAIGADDWEGRAQLAARAQPVAYEFPTPTAIKDDIPYLFHPYGSVIAIDNVIENVTRTASSWRDLKAYKYGLMSFLLPRLELSGGPGVSGLSPDRRIFERAQWLDHNPGLRLPDYSEASLRQFASQMHKQWTTENSVCVKWLPNLEHSVSGYSPRTGGSVLGIEIWTGGSAGGLHARRMTKADKPVAVCVATIEDAWDREFYYYSPPPYQSYTLWSAGADGKTYPPWIPSNEGDYKNNSRRERIVQMTKDDIVAGSL